MSKYTLEHTITSMRGWKRPLYTSNRVHLDDEGVRRRIKWLMREYGRENVSHRPKKGDDNTVEVYIRIN